ncbi:hypothetical protein ACRYCC_40975 [Actinomadura scrupuli]|uniref:hypothetical protein n=1 Tax=Actinomadura scrupuli TaxID=559629 RepID=UPI003D9731A7
MSQPGMRITVDAAMRARDVSRMPPDGKAAGSSAAPAAPAEPAKPRKGERRRLGKRAANTQKTESRAQGRESDPPSGG